MAAKTKKESLKTESISWVDAPQGYKLGLHDGKVVCQNPKGNLLASIPAGLKEDPLTDQLHALATWLEEHRMDCIHTVERWMLRSLMVPKELISQVWSDIAWKEALQNLVICPSSAEGKIDSETLGLLRDVDSDKGLGVVDVDGESRWLKSDFVAIPHPILIHELEELRELGSELGAEQKLEQLYRPVYQPKPDQLDMSALQDYVGGAFDQLNFALGVCRRLGYPVRGGYAICKVWEGVKPLEARFYVGSDYPEGPTETGELLFVDSQHRASRIRDVGPVTFSEGVRMASAIYAKRKVESQEENPA